MLAYYGHTYCHQVRVAEEVDAAERFALASPEPSIADLDAAVFAPRRIAPATPAAPAAPTAAAAAAAAAAPLEVVTKVAEATAAPEQWLSFPEAIADAHRVAMRSDPKVAVMAFPLIPTPDPYPYPLTPSPEPLQVVVMGEDIAQLGGIFQCTAGLWAEFGGQRVIETPISEACIGAAAVGAAATGRVVPIVEVQLMDIVHRR